MPEQSRGHAARAGALHGDRLLQHRLYNQRLTGEPFASPEAVVSWLGAVQAQEYYEAKWSLGMRLAGDVDRAVEQALAQGRILRTHVMRPTWHFVTPQDIRWLLQLTAPRVKVAIGTFTRKFGLDDAVERRSNEALAHALQGGKQLIRPEMEDVLRTAGILQAGDDRLKFTHLLMLAELDGVICSGARRGKQFTYALLEERAPLAQQLDEDQALAELTRRFFSSHGPATEYDFSWWSGLTLAQARRGLQMVHGAFVSAPVGPKTAWFPELDPPPIPRQQAWLLPSFDEYLIGYKDRSAALGPAHKYRIDTEISQPLLFEGRVIGTWKRHFGPASTQVAVRPFAAAFSQAQARAIEAAAARYSAFLQSPVELTFAP